MLAEQTLTLDRVSISPLLAEHVNETYVSWLNDPEVTKYTETTGLNTLQSVRAYVETALSARNAVMWRILCDADHHVGNIRLSNLSTLHQRAEVALMIGDRNFWGQGLATSAIRLITDYGFDHLHLRKLSAGVVEPNRASSRAFEKAGYELEATLRDHTIVGEDILSNLIFAKFNPDH
jgi:[ribosomal protein S5]-alanine N-acetyltransferase